jgi:hypothetical protein
MGAQSSTWAWHGDSEQSRSVCAKAFTCCSAIQPADPDVYDVDDAPSLPAQRSVFVGVLVAFHDSCIRALALLKDGTIGVTWAPSFHDRECVRVCVRVFMLTPNAFFRRKDTFQAHGAVDRIEIAKRIRWQEAMAAELEFVRKQEEALGPGSRA